MHLPTAYEVRAPTPDELTTVADVLIADELDDVGQIVLGAEFLQGEWSRLRFDLANDAWVVADDAGAIVAYGQAMRDEPTVVQSWGVVHPKHRGRGIGSSLLDRIEERASELLAGVRSGRFRHAINASDRVAAAMLSVRGLRPVHHFWHICRSTSSNRPSRARRRRGSSSPESSPTKISRPSTPAGLPLCQSTG